MVYRPLSESRKSTCSTGRGWERNNCRVKMGVRQSYRPEGGRCIGDNRRWGTHQWSRSTRTESSVAGSCRTPSSPFFVSVRVPCDIKYKSQGTKGREVKNPMNVLRTDVPPSLHSKVHRDRSVLGLVSQASLANHQPCGLTSKHFCDTTVKHTDTVIYVSALGEVIRETKKPDTLASPCGGGPTPGVMEQPSTV